MFTADPGSQQDLNQAHCVFIETPMSPKYGTSCMLYSAGDTGVQNMCIEWIIYTNSTYQTINLSNIYVLVKHIKKMYTK